MPSLRACTFILVMFFVLSPSPRANALEMSSKRNCAICHVMWLDDFRTDKETLIKWQPGNVLMKDTQGVVSSEDMCYSCHDGYVMDSRSVTWKYKGHRTFVKPSNKVAIPADMPLSNKDEIYCGTCHSAHGGGSNTDASISGGLSFLRKDNIDSQMCEMCHTKQAAFKRYYGHPVKTKSYDIPEVLFDAGSKRSRSGDRVICQTCHEVHGAKGDKILVIGNKSSDLCTACHQKQGSLIQTKHDFRVSLPDEKNIKGQRPSESGPCGACHLPHKAAGKMLWAKPSNSGNPASQMCLTCHGEDVALEIRHIGKYSHPLNVALASKISTTGGLPLFLKDGTLDPAGSVQCFTCHDVHRWNPQTPLITGGKNVEGNASNSFLRISGSSSSTLCTVCHEDKRQLLTSDHNLAATAPYEKNLQGFTTQVSGPCGACHIPHNAWGKRLWAKPLSVQGDFAAQICIGCHNSSGVAKAKLIGDNSHPIDVPLEKTKFRPLRQQAVRELPLYSKAGDRMSDGNILCITCHEPHTWDARKPGPLEDYAPQNMEGDATNSFLREANLFSPELCNICHPNKSRIDKTAHDLSETAPEAKNLLGQTVTTSGSCGVCHLVHNAPHKIKLWARAYGPTTENGSKMDGLCTSCHSKGNIAEKKIPPVASHPAGKLVTNIMRFNKEGKNYMPIFDVDGKENHLGNISCPTCHDAHQWGSPLKEVTARKKASGTSVKSFRFLRSMSYNIFCIDCHGAEAIYRYLYFHSPEKRSKR